MIAFLTVFLGLMHGVRPVQVVFGESVASVAFQLDGESVGRLEGPPWELDVDFGTEILPHELVVRAWNGRGEEVGVARQWINLPRPPAEVDVVLERGPDGRVLSARWTWETILGVQPKHVVVTFDRKPLPLDGVIDMSAERKRLQKEIEKAEGDRNKAATWLANEANVAKSPEHVVELNRERVAEAGDRIQRLTAALKRIEG